MHSFTELRCWNGDRSEDRIRSGDRFGARIKQIGDGIHCPVCFPCCALSRMPNCKFAGSSYSVVVKTAVVYCAVLEDEIEAFARQFPNVVRLEKLPQGLHNEPDRLRRELQALVDRLEEDPEVEAIALGYGLCSRGTEGVVAKRCRLVVPRAHDCITLFLGSKERYADYVRLHPGTYWYSPGWNRHHIPPGERRYHTLKAQYVERFGEEDAEYLMEEEQHWFSTYDRATWVDMGEGPVEEGIAETKKDAEWLGWNFDRQKGDPSLLRALLSGEWDADRFVVLEPGQRFGMTADERVIEVRDED